MRGRLKCEVEHVRPWGPRSQEDWILPKNQWGLSVTVMIYFKKDHTGHRVDNVLKGTEDEDIMTSCEAAVILVRNDSGIE